MNMNVVLCIAVTRNDYPSHQAVFERVLLQIQDIIDQFNIGYYCCYVFVNKSKVIINKSI